MGFCYHSVIVITFSVAQSDHIKQLQLCFCYNTIQLFQVQVSKIPYNIDLRSTSTSEAGPNLLAYSLLKPESNTTITESNGNNGRNWSQVSFSRIFVFSTYIEIEILILHLLSLNKCWNKPLKSGKRVCTYVMEFSGLFQHLFVD